MKGRAGGGGGGTKAETPLRLAGAGISLCKSLQGPGGRSGALRTPPSGWSGTSWMRALLAPPPLHFAALLCCSSLSAAAMPCFCSWRCPLSLAMPFPLAELSLALLLALVSMPGLAGPVSTCDANGSLYYVGEWYFLDSDHCTQCECTAEGPACARTECTTLPPACVHVSHYPSDCCPRCERVGCEYRGQVYELGQHFQPSECEQCTCDLDGIARCLVADCAPPPCVNPIYEKGHCCPTCKDGPNCYVDGSQHRVIPAGESIWVGPCTRCQCHDGQDAGYWEGNRVAKCERLRGCRATARHHA